MGYRGADNIPYVTKNTALHEAGHALDAARGQTSNTWATWGLDLMYAMELDDYYSQTGNVTGWLSEMYAEAHSAWLYGRTNGLSKDDIADEILYALKGGGKVTDWNLAEQITRSMVTYFEGTL